MARYRVLFWRDIPSLVEAFGEARTVQAQLSQRFQDLIDSVAMRAGATSTEAYLEAWRRGPEAERPGSPDRVASEVVAELEADFERLTQKYLLSPSSPQS